MSSSGVGFGTSGARGLADAMTDRVCHAYTVGFLQYLEVSPEPGTGGRAVAVAGDLRPSTGRIMAAVMRAAAAQGWEVYDCGRIPSPAVALFGLSRGIPAIMVTGSHIPEDRNGIKFNKAAGEILKPDEAGIAAQVVEMDERQFDATGAFAGPAPARWKSCPEALEEYARRYTGFFGPSALKGLRVGVYQHSAVGRDVLVRVLSEAGADVVALGRSEKFIPVDTEAIRPEDARLARQWAAEAQFDALVSADGDSDRPLISDEQGHWLRGDVAGILCAKFLGARSVCTPISCNTAVEKCGWFEQVRRTRIGSPFVIAAMIEAAKTGAAPVVGYEANGGFLVHSSVEHGQRTLTPLPTRDAAIVILSVLNLAREAGRSVAALTTALPQRFTASDRLKNFNPERSASLIAGFSSGREATDREAIERALGSLSGKVKTIDRTDGLRVTFENAEIIHFRPSGNAPEFRCYTEAATDERARELNEHALTWAANAEKQAPAESR